MTNAEVMRKGAWPLCEWNPWGERPARLSEGFHARAEVVVGKRSKESAAADRQLRLCRACAERKEALDSARTPGKGLLVKELFDDTKGGWR